MNLAEEVKPWSVLKMARCSAFVAEYASKSSAQVVVERMLSTEVAEVNTVLRRL